MNITIRFGQTNEVTKEFPEGTTVGQVLGNSNIRATLGFGDNVQAVIDGSVQASHTRLADGDVLTVETKANSKA